MSMTRNIALISLIVIIGVALSTLFHFCVSNFYGQSFYPYNTFLFEPFDRFNDFLNIYYATRDLTPYVYPVSVYFPFTFMPMYLLTLIPPGPALILFTGLFLVVVIWSLQRALSPCPPVVKTTAIAALGLLSYPIMFTIDRGNMEMLVFIFIIFFLYFYQKNDDAKSVIFLSLAIAMKLYPGVLVVLFLADKKYKNILYCTLWVIFVSFVSLLLLNSSVTASLAGLQHNLSLFKSSYLSGTTGLQHNSSLFGMLRIAQLKISSLDLVLNMYSLFAMSLFVLVSLYVITVERAFWKRVSLLVLMAILLPQVSFDYKLVHILIILSLYFKRERNGGFDLAYAVLLGLLLIPKDYFILFADVSIAVIINPLLMLMFCALIIVEGLRPLLLTKEPVSGKA